MPVSGHEGGSLQSADSAVYEYCQAEYGTGGGGKEKAEKCLFPSADAG